LRTQTFALLSVLEVDAAGDVHLPEQVPEARLLVPNSGLSAIILDQNNQVMWQSESSLGVDLANIEKEVQGSETFRQDGNQLSSPFIYSFSISWETENNVEHEFTLVTIEASNHFVEFVEEHRKKIILWLGLAGLFLLIMQMIALRWSLTPLVNVTNELDQIEHGKQDRIKGIYPEEIAQLSRRINLFVSNERKNMERYRNTLGDLAHSLKTPLAVLQGFAESDSPVDHKELDNYVGRMTNIVEYQLKRAASSTVSLIHTIVNVRTVFDGINESMQKVYVDKNIELRANIDASTGFYGNKSDLYELIGNVIDNAYKWANKRISFSASSMDVVGSHIDGVELVIEDDGPGIANNISTLVLQRGVRADQRMEGQGIGLAVCREIIERYDGDLEIARSDMGGALLRIKLRPATESSVLDP
jgi:two-component system sensor histidine kinase PhoQ